MKTLKEFLSQVYEGGVDAGDRCSNTNGYHNLQLHLMNYHHNLEKETNPSCSVDDSALNFIVSGYSAELEVIVGALCHLSDPLSFLSKCPSNSPIKQISPTRAIDHFKDLSDYLEDVWKLEVEKSNYDYKKLEEEKAHLRTIYGVMSSDIKGGLPSPYEN